MGNRKYRKLKKHEHEQVITAFNTIKNYSVVGRLFNIDHTSVMYIVKKSGYFLEKKPKEKIQQKYNKPRELIDKDWYQTLAQQDIQKRKQQMKIGLEKIHAEDERIKNLPKRIIFI